jgi:hypothetical protein
MNDALYHMIDTADAALRTLPPPLQRGDERRREEQLGKHWFGPHGKSSKGKGHPVLFGFSPARVFDDFPEGGGYPIGFMKMAYKTLGVQNPDNVLHLCCGSVKQGIRVDIRESVGPDILADCRNVPLPADSVRWIMADPPYSKEYAKNLYGTEGHYPLPSEILGEASRLLVPGGRVGLLHFQVPMFRKPLRLIGVWGISTGLGYAIRAWTVFEKADSGPTLVPETNEVG